MLIQTLRTTQEVFSACWPRLSLPGQCRELILAISLCWIHTKDELDETGLGCEVRASLQDIVREILITGDLVRLCLGRIETPPGFELLFRHDPSLVGVFTRSVES